MTPADRLHPNLLHNDTSDEEVVTSDRVTESMAPAAPPSASNGPDRHTALRQAWQCPETRSRMSEAEVEEFLLRLEMDQLITALEDPDSSTATAAGSGAPGPTSPGTEPTGHAGSGISPSAPSAPSSSLSSRHTTASPPPPTPASLASVGGTSRGRSDSYHDQGPDSSSASAKVWSPSPPTHSRTRTDAEH